MSAGLAFTSLAREVGSRPPRGTDRAGRTNRPNEPNRLTTRYNTCPENELFPAHGHRIRLVDPQIGPWKRCAETKPIVIWVASRQRKQGRGGSSRNEATGILVNLAHT